MNHARATSTLWRIGTASHRIRQVSRRTHATKSESTPPQPTPPHVPSSPPNSNSTPKEPSRVGAYYKSFSYPVLKTFLIALLTYQIAYYVWLKLETIEEKYDKSTEISDLQKQLRDAVAKQKHRAGDMVDQAVGKVGQVTEDTKEAGRAVVESVRDGKEEVVKATGAVGKVSKGGWWPW
ncbi:hypothetical protein GQ44DRAFT_726320 [Phaeosphaeriaceae sp. PMI808]|nr:hypothetical protein GQ44DRAFT_726320 [Phaeosphaeriaceae sp. PMI808]